MLLLFWPLLDPLLFYVHILLSIHEHPQLFIRTLGVIVLMVRVPDTFSLIFLSVSVWGFPVLTDIIKGYSREGIPSGMRNSRVISMLSPFLRGGMPLFFEINGYSPREAEIVRFSMLRSSVPSLRMVMVGEIIMPGSIHLLCVGMIIRFTE